MPRPDRIGANFGLTINIGNYETVRIDAYYETNVDAGKLPEDVYAEIYRFCRKQVMEQVKAIKPRFHLMDEERNGY